MTDKKRSLAQNKYRWGVIVDTVLKYINAELENDGCEYRATPNDIDLLIKEHALKIVHRIPTSLGELIIQGRLKTRTKKDFEEAMEQIRAHFAQRKNPIFIPLPNEDLRDLQTQFEDNLSRE